MRHAVLDAGIRPVFLHIGEHLRHVDFRRVLPRRLEDTVAGAVHDVTGGVHFAVFCEPAGKLLALGRREGTFGEFKFLARFDLHGLHRARAAVGVKGDGEEVLDRERGGHDELAALIRQHLFSLLSVDGDLHGFTVGKVVAALRGEQEVQRVALALLKRAGVYRHAAADSPVGALNDILRTGIGRHRGICRALARNRALHREGGLADDVSGGHLGLERKRHLADLGVSGVVLVGDLLDSGVIERQDVPTVDLADRAAGPVARAGGREVCALRRAVARQVGIDLILEVFIHLDVVDVARAVHIARIERRVAAQIQPREAVILAVERFELFVAAQVERLDLVVVAVQSPELGAAAHIQLCELHFVTRKLLQIAQRVKIELGDRIVVNTQILEGDVVAQVERGELVFIAAQLLEHVVAAHIERGELVIIDIELNQLPVVAHIERGQLAMGDTQKLQLGVFADINGFEVMIAPKIEICQLRQVPGVEGRQRVRLCDDFLELFVGAQVERGELIAAAGQLDEL